MLNNRIISTMMMGVSVLAMSVQASAQSSSQSRRSVQDIRTVQQSSFPQAQHSRFRCERGEKKHFIIAGNADNFSTSGSEPAIKSARVAAHANNSQPAWNQGLAASFDNQRVNQKVFSHLTLPVNITRGRFMVGMRTIGELVNTDGMNIGNLSQGGMANGQRAAFGYNNGWGSMTGSGWAQSGTNYAANFSSINMLNGTQTLASYYQASNDTTLDVYIQDDHSVDYIAASVCTAAPKPVKKGMTWGVRDPAPEPVNGVLHVGCNDKNGQKCEPYNGDTLCTTPLPLLCVNPLKLQKPQNLTESRWDKWSGFVIGTTDPMAAPATLAQANQACEAEFGKGWRVGEHHDALQGRSGWMFSGYGNVGTKSKRFWTDIKNQPNGVCWVR